MIIGYIIASFIGFLIGWCTVIALMHKSGMVSPMLQSMGYKKIELIEKDDPMFTNHILLNINGYGVWYPKQQDNNNGTN